MSWSRAAGHSVPVYSVRPLDDARIFVVGVSVIEAREFLEVCGALMPLMGSAVEVLRFQRFDRFWENVKRTMGCQHAMASFWQRATTQTLEFTASRAERLKRWQSKLDMVYDVSHGVC